MCFLSGFCRRRTCALGGLLLAATLPARPAAAQAAPPTDTIRLADHRLRPARLHPGVRQYLVYFQTPARPRELRFWLWRREVRRASHQGTPVLRIEQRWLGPDTASYRASTSLVRAADFAPLYHAETIQGQRRAYLWSPTQVAGADTVPGNQARGARQALRQPTFNWNLDLETFELLPLAAGKRFAIPFYDAGSHQAPAYVVYTVTGRDQLGLPGRRRPVPCWKLVTEGRTPTGAAYTQTFWLSRRGHELLQEADQLPGGLVRYKLKTSSTLPGPPGAR